MSPEENRADEGGATSPSRASSSSGQTAWWIALGALAVIAIALYAWKVVAVNRAEDRLEEARQEWRAESRQALEERTRTLLRLSAEPLGLAVRDAAMEENYGTVGTYLDRVARIEGVRGAVLAIGDTVRVSTDETQEGRALSAVVPGGIDGGADARVEVVTDGIYHVGVPITGLNERIGTLVLIYAPPGSEAEEGGAAPADTTGGG